MPIRKVLFSLAAGFVLAASPVLSEDALRTLTVTGEGRASGAPDMATVNLGVQREARQARAAMAAASEAAGAVLATLGDAGIESRDIQTTRVGLDPVYARQSDNAPPRITGYVASNDLVVRVRDLSSLGAVLDAVVSDGANTFRGIRFGISDPTVLAAEARTAAVGDAIARAETLAAAAGLSLGDIHSLSEGGGGAIPQPMMRAAVMAESAVPVAQGEVDITARVTIVYAIDE